VLASDRETAWARACLLADLGFFTPPGAGASQVIVGTPDDLADVAAQWAGSVDGLWVHCLTGSQSADADKPGGTSPALMKSILAACAAKTAHRPRR
jgi:hypothetical protein